MTRLIHTLAIYVRAYIPGETETNDKMSRAMNANQFCYIGSRFGWVSALLYYHIISHDSPATRQHTHTCTVINRVFRREIQVVG